MHFLIEHPFSELQNVKTFAKLFRAIANIKKIEMLTFSNEKCSWFSWFCLCSAIECQCLILAKSKILLIVYLPKNGTSLMDDPLLQEVTHCYFSIF